MKVFPFKIPKPRNETLVYQEDKTTYFYDRLHQHIEIQISRIVSGEGTLIIGDSVNEYKAGDILVVGGNLPHVFKSDIISDKSHMQTLFFSKDSFGKGFFELDNFRGLESFFKKSKNGFKILNNQSSIYHLFQQLKNAQKIERFILLFKMLDYISNSETELLSSFIYPKNYSDNEGKRMRDVFEYTMNNFSKNISLKEIADIANMTTNAFCRYFKIRTNKTYVQFLTELRIENAAKLLKRNQDLSIVEIASLSGFKNISNFNRKFKLLKKITPLKYQGNYIKLSLD